MFAYDAPVPPEQFVGRMAVLDQIAQRLNHVQVLSASIVGGPKTGKSSLLRYLSSAEADGLLPKIPKSNRLYFDAQGLAGAARSFDFWAGVFRDLKNQSEKPPLKDSLTQALAKARAGSLDVFDLEDVFDEFAQVGAPVILCIGNFQALLRNPNFWPPDNFLHVVRSLGQRQPRGIAFVLGTTRPLLDLWDPTRGASPYYNIFLNFSVGRLEDAEVTALVASALSHASLPADPALGQLVLSAGFNHPRLTSYAIFLCIQSLQSGQQPSPEQIARAFAEPDGLLVALIREIRAQLAPSELRLIELSKNAPSSISASQKAALQRLKDYGLLPPGITV
jgi:hypothetical protein